MPGFFCNPSGVKNGNMPFIASIRELKNLDNGNLDLAITLDLLQELESQTYEQFLDKWIGIKKNKKVGRKKSKDFTVEDAEILIKDYEDEFDKKVFRNKYHPDGNIIQYQFVKYALDSGISVSESTIIRRFKDAKD